MPNDKLFANDDFKTGEFTALAAKMRLKMTKENLKAWRSELNKSQMDMAIMLSVPFWTYRNWENGKGVAPATETMLYAMKVIIQKRLYGEYKELREVEELRIDKNGLYPGEKIEEIVVDNE